ncbi:MAG: hypothetical protein ABIR26_04140 [Ramlibacter sp.]
MGYYNDKGQRDGQSGRKRQVPHGGLSDALTWSRSGMKKNASENRQYFAGYNNGQGQRKK